MTNEQKQLLLKDLCGRLPYGVKVLANIDKTFDGGCVGVVCKMEPYVGEKFPHLKGEYLLYQRGCLTPLILDEVKPYLRSMSSMTEEEKYTYRHMLGATLNSEGESIMFVYVEDFPVVIDWLNTHQFDYRGLIEKGLALEAPKDMYKEE